MFDVMIARCFVAPRKRLPLVLLGLALLAGCGAPPDQAGPAGAGAPTAAPTIAPPPSLLPTVEATIPPTPSSTPTPEQAPVSTQTAIAQQLNVAQQTAVAAQSTASTSQQLVTVQQGQIQTLAANQTVTAQQMAVVQQAAATSQQTAVAAQQGLTALQTTVANLVGQQQTAVATREVPPPTQVPPTATATPTTLYPWYFKRPTEAPQLCGPGQSNPCVDTAPNEGTQYISGHVIDPHGAPVAGITVQAKSDSVVLFNTTDQTGYYSILLYTACPGAAQKWDVYIVDGRGQLSSYVKELTYSNCKQAGEFHVDFVQVAR